MFLSLFIFTLALLLALVFSFLIVYFGGLVLLDGRVECVINQCGALRFTPEAFTASVSRGIGRYMEI
jgi:hypothetical protein